MRSIAPVVLLASVAIFMAGCVEAEQPRGPSGRSEAAVAAHTERPRASRTPSASTNLPPTGSATVGSVLFGDDFSDADSGWHREPTEAQRGAGLNLGYGDGQYRIEVAPGVKLTYSVPAPPSESADAIRLMIDMEKSGQPAVAGVYCRSDEANQDFYVFTIDTDGFHAIGKVVDGEPSRLWAGAEPSPAIRGPGEVNHLEAECIGQGDSVLLRLSVNGQELIEHEDPDPIEGSNHSTQGLFVETTSAGDVELQFDNYRLTQIRASP